MKRAPITRAQVFGPGADPDPGEMNTVREEAGSQPGTGPGSRKRPVCILSGSRLYIPGMPGRQPAELIVFPALPFPDPVFSHLPLLPALRFCSHLHSGVFCFILSLSLSHLLLVSLHSFSHCHSLIISWYLSVHPLIVSLSSSPGVPSFYPLNRHSLTFSCRLFVLPLTVTLLPYHFASSYPRSPSFLPVFSLSRSSSFLFLLLPSLPGPPF